MPRSPSRARTFTNTGIPSPPQHTPMPAMTCYITPKMGLHIRPRSLILRHVLRRHSPSHCSSVTWRSIIGAPSTQGHSIYHLCQLAKSKTWSCASMMLCECYPVFSLCRHAVSRITQALRSPIAQPIQCKEEPPLRGCAGQLLSLLAMHLTRSILSPFSSSSQANFVVAPFRIPLCT